MHKKIALGALAFALVAPVGIAFARENQQQGIGKIEPKRIGTEVRAEIKTGNLTAVQENKNQEAKAKRLEFQDKKEKMAQEKCRNIESKISTQFKRYENNGKMLQNVYGNMQTRLTRLVERLDKAGADTTKLKTDFATLNEKISKLHADQANLLITLQASQAFVCDGTEAEFKGRLENARKVPELIRQDRQDIKNFFQTTIKADLQAIRATLTDQKEEIEKPEEIKKPKKAVVAPTPEVAPAPVQ